MALSVGAYTEADLEKLSRLAWTRDVGITLVPVDVDCGTNRVREMVEDYEDKEPEAV